MSANLAALRKYNASLPSKFSSDGKSLEAPKQARLQVSVRSGSTDTFMFQHQSGDPLHQVLDTLARKIKDAERGLAQAKEKNDVLFKNYEEMNEVLKAFPSQITSQSVKLAIARNSVTIKQDEVQANSDLLASAEAEKMRLLAEYHALRQKCKDQQLLFVTESKEICHKIRSQAVKDLQIV